MAQTGSDTYAIYTCTADVDCAVVQEIAQSTTLATFAASERGVGCLEVGQRSTGGRS